MGLPDYVSCEARFENIEEHSDTIIIVYERGMDGTFLAKRIPIVIMKCHDGTIPFPDRRRLVSPP
jgi:hypothetical protein